MSVALVVAPLGHCDTRTGPSAVVAAVAPAGGAEGQPRSPTDLRVGDGPRRKEIARRDLSKASSLRDRKKKSNLTRLSRWSMLKSSSLHRQAS